MHSRLQRLQERPVLAVLLFAAAVVGAVSAVWEALGWARDRVEDVAQPYREEYAALDQLDLDVRLEYFEDTFGVARAVVDPCTSTSVPCPEPRPESMQLFVHETDETVVRALFADNSLAAYLVTTTTEGFEPAIRWIDLELGPLGAVSTAEILDSVGVDVVAGASVRSGMVWHSYAEVVPGGAPASYRGLVLAWVGEGLQSQFDLDAFQRLEAAQEAAADGAAFSAALDDMRTATAPNTYGEFRDDGPLATWLHDPEVIHDLLFAGSEV
ncbi:ETEC_3214 domain-containing protein [Cellulomonas cellasea]|uniref:Uncharacterized protein n=1 Tax=Cellulomonas cellasea DSM 20118 TaxID=1408250 RepID=A0A0A0B9E6_9CELL|nr:ETEC_3214 domain-containing protein [Cellulomonas cellasea]KGM02828.1 hypothetical protein Q760_11085 [Cellulomonas cellasea DSM 20118]